jgi:uncharacterized protein YihD (DUF1040 family)
LEEKPYSFSLIRKDFRYEFFSVSEKKKVKKVVIFSLTDNENIYNLALLDSLQNGDLCDITETKNEDFKTVLSTTIKIIEHFLNTNPKYFVLFKGSEEKRHRLYRIVISRQIIEIKEKFNVFGVINNEIVPFLQNEDYDYYLIKLL